MKCMPIKDANKHWQQSTNAHLIGLCWKGEAAKCSVLNQWINDKLKLSREGNNNEHGKL